MRIIKNPIWGNREKTQIMCTFEFDDGRVLIASVMDTEEGNPDWQEIFDTFSIEEIDKNTEKDKNGVRKNLEEKRLADEQRQKIEKQNVLFMAKSEAFEIDLIRNSDEVELKTKLRQAKTLIEINSIAGAIYAVETLKARS